MTDPAPGDYVGVDQSTSDDLYVCAVDCDTRKVKIGTLGGDSEWLTETEARARYSYEWGAHKPLPWLVKTMAALCPHSRSFYRQCPNLGLPPHPCPYQEEINGDHKTLCTCCDKCSLECADDI